MKKIFLTCTLLFISFSLSSDELQWVNEQIEAIKPPREGVSDANISSLSDPFIFLNEGESIAKITTEFTTNTTGSKQIIKKIAGFYVSTIINKSAMINGKWYTINDKIGYYTVTNIDRTSVTLSAKGKEIVLSTITKNLNLKFNNK